MVSATGFNYLGLSSDYYPAVPGGIGILDALLSQDNASGGEIGSLNKLGKLVNRSFRIINEIGDSIAYPRSNYAGEYWLPFPPQFQNYR